MENQEVFRMTRETNGNFPKIYFDKNTKTNKGFQDGQSSLYSKH